MLNQADPGQLFQFLEVVEPNCYHHTFEEYRYGFGDSELSNFVDPTLVKAPGFVFRNQHP
tara:strand:- start:971 stop:1150 length:180 start_codon:yes stop_codon:yes gene_type:complete